LFRTIRDAWKIPDLRKKLLFTLFVIIVFRVGSVITVPFLDMTALGEVMKAITDPLTADGAANSNASSFMGYMDTLSGGAFSNATLFAMGVTPYINSSIIMQLLTVAIPALERLQKEGEAGRKKIGAITRYVTVGLGLLQGLAYFFYLLQMRVVNYTEGFDVWFAGIVIVLAFTAGTALMMWLGEQINNNGIGNGISILLFTGIIARMPQTIEMLGRYLSAGAVEGGNTTFFFTVPLWIIIFLAVIWVITFMQDSERRIPVQYAKRVVGRKMYGGQSSHLPIKVALGGVLPIIFASSILMIPSTIQMFWPAEGNGFMQGFYSLFGTSGWLYSVLYFIFIIGFAYFYTNIQYNPVEMANNLKQNNGTIPGIRPGAPTSEFIKKILSRITFIGALFLALIAILPIVYGNVTQLAGLQMGGTSIIILVGVALDTVKQIESQMMMRHYKGFLD
jgi:preprotein translocase subunit SecY